MRLDYKSMCFSGRQEISDKKKIQHRWAGMRQLQCGSTTLLCFASTPSVKQETMSSSKSEEGRAGESLREEEVTIAVQESWGVKSQRKYNRTTARQHQTGPF